MDDTELDAIETQARIWQMMPAFEKHAAPTLKLAAELRGERERASQLADALETLTKNLEAAHDEGETFPLRVSVAFHAAEIVLERAGVVSSTKHRHAPEWANMDTGACEHPDCVAESVSSRAPEKS